MSQNQNTNTVIVTGAAGYIGGATCIALKEKGYRVVGIDLRPLPEHLESYVDQFVKECFTHPWSLEHIEREPIAIIHCAGTSLVGPSIKNPHDYYENNVVRTEKYLDYIRRWSPNTKFILLSRKDKLKQFVSDQLAKVSNKYSTRDPEHKIYNSINLVVDPNEFNKYKNDSDLHYKKYKEKLADHNYLELVYEDDVENDLADTIEKIDKWLKDNDIVVERKSYNLIYQKQNTRSLADTIVNYSDITK